MDPAGIAITPGTNGESSAHELFLLSDEQILEIEPEAAEPAPVGQPFLAVPPRDTAVRPDPQNHPSENSHNDAMPAADRRTDRAAQPEMAVPPEPPPWLAAQMKDPWGGEEAREFWNGVQQARTEAAAYQVYRAAIASPEDARALKELYPGGISEARAAADRARLLDEVDRAYFGGAGNSPEQTSASRVQLAQQLLREDPAAFREMVVAGLHALEEAEKGSGAAAASDLPRLAKLFAEGGKDINVALRLRATSLPADSAAATSQTASLVAAQHAAPLQRNAAGSATPGAQALHESPARPVPDGVTSPESLSAYASFERAANEDLEHTVGAAIERTLQQALPVAQPFLAVRGSGAQAQPPDGRAKVPALRERLSAAIRQDVEHALQGDRQLGEQVAQILASRRFDGDTRAQVVRLINERAQQLVPGAAKRVLNEWTQTTMAAHRSRAERSDANASRREVAPVNPEPRRASVPARQSEATTSLHRLEASATKAPRRVDYRKLSDEQILNMS